MEQPKWTQWMLPELMCLSDNKEHHRNEIIESAAEYLHLPEELKSEMINSNEARYVNRAGWALTYLKQSGLIDSTKRAYFKITDLGKKLLTKKPKELKKEDLKQYKGYQEFVTRNRKTEKQDVELKYDLIDDDAISPIENLKNSYEMYRQSVCDDMLDILKKCDDRFFERICVKLITAMGYGDGQTTPRSHDGGIDGIINQDKLGLDKIYIQAKRYNNHKVSRPEVNKFVGAVDMNGAKKGIFVTTDSFVSTVANVSSNSGIRIIFIDGQQLVRLMYDYNVGVTAEDSFVIKKIDADYFE